VITPDSQISADTTLLMQRYLLIISKIMDLDGSATDFGSLGPTRLVKSKLRIKRQTYHRALLHLELKFKIEPGCLKYAGSLLPKLPVKL